MTEKAAEASDHDQRSSHPGPDRPHRDQPAEERAPSAGSANSRSRSAAAVWTTNIAPIALAKPRQRAEDEIAGPADRLQHPEGAVLVVEERAAVQPERIPASSAPDAEAGAAIWTALLATIRFSRRSSSRKNQHRPVTLVGDVGRDRAPHVLGGQRAIVGEIGADMLDRPRDARSSPPARRASSCWSPAAARCRSPPDSAPAELVGQRPAGRRGRR